MIRLSMKIIFVLWLHSLALTLQAGADGDICSRVATNNQDVFDNAFTTNRGLPDYSRYPFKKSPSLFEMVNSLGSGNIWADMGAGQELALAQGLALNSEIGLGVAVAHTPLAVDGAKSFGKRYESISGDFVENLYLDGKFAHLEGKIDLITDIYGPLSYSEDFVRVLQIYLNLLKPDGSLVFNLMLERSPSFGPSPVNPVRFAGLHYHHALIEWIRTIPGIEFEIAYHKLENERGWENSVGFKIVKKKSEVVVPKTLITEKYDSGAPPQRVFRIIDDALVQEKAKLDQQSDLESLHLKTQNLELRPVDISHIDQVMPVLGSMDRASVENMLRVSVGSYSEINLDHKLINFGVYLKGELIGFFQISRVNGNIISQASVGSRREKWVSISGFIKMQKADFSKDWMRQANQKLAEFAFIHLGADGLYGVLPRDDVNFQARKTIVEKYGLTPIDTKDLKNQHFSYPRGRYILSIMRESAGY